MKLSFKDKCWLVANIKRVFVGPACFSIILIASIYSTHKRGFPTFFDVFGFWNLLVLVIVGIYALKYAYQIAKFAETNFDEVLSRRTKWRVSNVELHEMKYRFVWETFGWALFSIYIPVVSIVWLINYSINV